MPQRSSLRPLRLLTAVLAVALVAGACGDGNEGGDDNEADRTPDASGGTTEAEPPAESEQVTVLLSFQQGISFWPLHVADELGYFEEAGLDVNIEVADGSPFVVQQVSAGNEPFGVPIPEPAMLGFEQNPSFVSIYEFLTGNSFNLWVREDSPIQSLDDLEPGAKVGITRQSGGDIARLTVALQKAGLDVGSTVTFTEFGFNPAVAADLLQTQDADVISISWNMFVGAKLALAEEGVDVRCLTCTDEEQYAAESIIVTKDFLDENRSAVEGFGRALAKATLFGETNPEAAIEIMKKVAPEEQTDPAYTKAFFEAALDITSPRPEKDQYGWQDPTVYQRSMEVMLDPENPQGLPSEIDLEAFLDNSMVDAYNDFDHEAVEQQAASWTP